MLSQNMVPWHVDYFKLKEFEKMAEAERSTLTCPPCPSSLKQVIKLPREMYPPSTKRKEDSLITRNRELGGREIYTNKPC